MQKNYVLRSRSRPKTGEAPKPWERHTFISKMNLLVDREVRLKFYKFADETLPLI